MLRGNKSSVVKGSTKQNCELEIGKGSVNVKVINESNSNKSRYVCYCYLFVCLSTVFLCLFIFFVPLFIFMTNRLTMLRLMQLLLCTSYKH